ncbi:MAG TPA: aroma-sacti cluster domain-containing protein [Streptosporangiaceae bacterium]|nr:aroma-sacti cluster domain-containing protein [Streptosporangiaceae bacterium]
MTSPEDLPAGPGPAGRPDPLERLSLAGFDLSLFDGEQLALLAALSEGELTVLLDIRERVGDVHAEVEAHGGTPMTIGGLLF